MFESEIILEGCVDFFDEHTIEARVRPNQLYEYDFEVHPDLFPIPLKDLQGGEIFYMLANGTIRIPPPWTQEELDAARTRRSETLNLLFEGTPEGDAWNSQSEISPTNETKPNDGHS